MIQPRFTYKKLANGKQAGFTLIELIITVGILAIIAAFAAPNMGDVINRNNISQETNRMVSAIQFLRSETIKRNQPMGMRSEVSYQWHKGWNVYAGDLTALGNAAKPADSERIRVFDPSSNSSITVVGNGAAGMWLSFRSNGMLNEGGNTAVIYVCGRNDPSTGKQITIDRGGRALVSDIPDDDDCDPK